MTLVKQTIDIPFGQGIDTATDERNVLPGKLLTLENGVFDKLGRVSKRPGLVDETPSPVGLAAPTGGTLYANDVELLVRESTSAGAARRITVNDTQSKFSNGGIFPRLESDLLAADQYVVSGQAAVIPDGVLDPVGRKYGMAVSGPQLTLFDYTTKEVHSLRELLHALQMKLETSSREMMETLHKMTGKILVRIARGKDSEEDEE